MEEKLQDAAGTSRCTVSNAGMSTNRDRAMSMLGVGIEYGRPVFTRLGAVVSIWKCDVRSVV